METLVAWEQLHCDRELYCKQQEKATHVRPGNETKLASKRIRRLVQVWRKTLSFCYYFLIFVYVFIIYLCLFIFQRRQITIPCPLNILIWINICVMIIIQIYYDFDITVPGKYKWHIFRPIGGLKRRICKDVWVGSEMMVLTSEGQTFLYYVFIFCMFK